MKSRFWQNNDLDDKKILATTVKMAQAVKEGDFYLVEIFKDEKSLF